MGTLLKDPVYVWNEYIKYFEVDGGVDDVIQVGPPHSPTFTVKARFGKKCFNEFDDKTKAVAKKKAAYSALCQLASDGKMSYLDTVENPFSMAIVNIVTQNSLPQQPIREINSLPGTIETPPIVNSNALNADYVGFGSLTSGRHPINMLQEFCISKGWGTPTYDPPVNEGGSVIISCHVQSATTTGKALKRKEAKFYAAANMMNRMKEHDPNKIESNQIPISYNNVSGCSYDNVSLCSNASSSVTPLRNPVSILYEYAQKINELISFNETFATGNGASLRHTVLVKIGEKEYLSATDTKKKDAKTAAAYQTLKMLDKEKNLNLSMNAHPPTSETEDVVKSFSNFNIKDPIVVQQQSILNSIKSNSIYPDRICYNLPIPSIKRENDNFNVNLGVLSSNTYYQGQFQINDTLSTSVKYSSIEGPSFIKEMKISLKEDVTRNIEVSICNECPGPVKECLQLIDCCDNRKIVFINIIANFGSDSSALSPKLNQLS